MASSMCQLSEDQFLCSICLEVFTHPVTIPCGHNFCKSCIDEHWNIESTCKCPYCKQVFNPKPDLRVNIFISEMADQFRQSQRRTEPSSEEIFCDFCTDPKSRAVKHCLACMSSFCEHHLESHLMMETLQQHKLVDPKRNLLSKVEEETTRETRTNTETQEMITMRQRTIQELCKVMELNNKDANIEITNAVVAFTALKECVEKDLDNLIQDITRRKRTTEDSVKDCLKELQQEMAQLRNGATTVTRDWANLKIHKPSYEGAAARALAQLDQKLSQQMCKAFAVELQRVKQFHIYVRLEPSTVPAKSTNQGKRSDEKPECKCVLASQSFSTGKFYFEMDVRSKSKWVLGLAKELCVDRQVALNPRNGFWIICMRKKREWYAGSEPSMRLSLKTRPEKVGVFVDYEEGLVSFYDANQAGLIYTFTGCNFTHKVHPFFSPCENDGVQLHTMLDSSCVLQ